MLMTEDEAKQKACCKTMPNRPDGKLVTAACLGSDCMAWRWISPGSLNDERGYCGLAGIPE